MSEAPQKETRLQLYRRRLQEMKTERSSWDAHWKELGQYFAPRATRFFQEETNRGNKKHQYVVNSKPVRARLTCAAGMSGGMTSPARPWFRLTTPDPRLAEKGAVRAWLHQVEERMRMAMQLSNVYSALPIAYADLCTFGTHGMLLEEDAKTIIRATSMPIGSFYLGASASGRVDECMREFRMTVRQLVEKFGVERVSATVKNLWEQQRFNDWVTVVHSIGPNMEQQRGYADARGMPWKSCWWEAEAPDVSAGPQFLKESGYQENPVVAARWLRTGDDVYGSDCPGMNALGDAKSLLFMEKRKATIVDHLARPAMKAPASARGTRVSAIPGDTTYLEQMTAGQTYEPVYTPDANAITACNEIIVVLKSQIGEHFFEDLWSLLTMDRGTTKTATEVEQLNEERMLQLGPVLEALHDELLSPIIDRFFGVMNRMGLFDLPPPELQGMPLRVEYISILAAAQKAIHVVGVQRLASFVASLAQIKGDVLDKLDFDEVVDEFADALGVKPDLVRRDEVVEQLRAARAEQQRAQAALEQGQQMAGAARDLAAADASGDNALTRIAQTLGPMAAQAVGA